MKKLLANPTFKGKGVVIVLVSVPECELRPLKNAVSSLHGLDLSNSYTGDKDTRETLKNLTPSRDETHFYVSYIVTVHQDCAADFLVRTQSITTLVASGGKEFNVNTYYCTASIYMLRQSVKAFKGTEIAELLSKIISTLGY